MAEFERYARRVRLNADAPVRLLERASAADADPAVYGPILEQVLAEAGGFLAPRALTLRLQLAALARGVRLPPSGVNWFILSAHPAYARLRPVWSAAARASADEGYLNNEGVMLVEGGVVAFEARELRKLAQSIESGGGGAAATADAAARVLMTRP